MSIVVRGGAGFIGSHAAEASLARDLAVTAFGDLSSGQRENLAAVPIIPMFDPGRSGTTFTAPAAMCHALQKGIDNGRLYSHEESS